MTNVYIFDFGNRIKIGKSNRVAQRLKAIENQSGEKVKQMFSIETDSTKEKILHNYLHEYRTVGEYFNCSFETAKTALHSILEGKIKLERKKKEQLNSPRGKKTAKTSEKIQKIIDNAHIIVHPRPRGNSSVSNKIKAFLKIKGKDTSALAEHLNISKQALSNKYYRDSFSAEDLIKIADFLKCDLALIDNTDRVNFDISDIKAGE